MIEKTFIYLNVACHMVLIYVMSRIVKSLFPCHVNRLA
jgi:hypothetical protein